MNKLLKTLFCCILIAICANSLAYTVETVPNPKSATSDGFVSNPDSILRPEIVEQLNDISAILRKEIDVELAVVVINGMDGDYIEHFANSLYNYWGIGSKEKSQGVLMLLDIDERVVRIEVGDGCEGLLPDLVCDEIIQDHMVPHLAQNDFNQGMLAGAVQIAQKLTTESAQAELLLGYKRKIPKQKEYPYLYWYVVFCFVALLISVLIAAQGTYGNPSKNNEKRYELAHKMSIILILLAIIFPFTVAFIAYFFNNKGMRQIRNRPVKCPKCNHDMQLLSEEEEDQFLSDTQITEEKIKSIDYDVWECPDCKDQIIYKFINYSSSYSKCPRCGARTFSTTDKVLKAATEYSTGSGLHISTCAHCRHRVEVPYTIPRVTPSDSDSGGSSHSSGGGGSWGGGHSSGGGATGRF